MVTAELPAAGDFLIQVPRLRAPEDSGLAEGAPKRRVVYLFLLA
jgi:hypothetical protein